MKILLTRRRAARGLALLPFGSLFPCRGSAAERPLATVKTAAWVWNVELADAAAVNAFALEEGIKTLFVSVPMSARSQLAAADPATLERLKSLANGGVELWASAGDPGWAEQPERGMLALRWLFALQERHVLFHGLHLDVEPHAHPRWQREPRARGELAQGYLALLERVGRQTNGLPIDAATHPSMAALSLSAGATLLEQAIRHVSSVCIMAYRNTAAATIAWAQPSVRIVEAAAVPWRVGVLVHATREEGISFAGSPARSFLEEMRRLDSQLRAAYGERLYRGIAFEDYAGLGTLLRRS